MSGYRTRTASRVLHSRAFVCASQVLLLALVVVQTARYWRYFPMFMADHGWYLQVAARISQGEVLYRDVAWAYGPWPAHVLAALFRAIQPDAALATLLNGLLAAASLLLTFAAVRSLLQARDAVFVTAFAALAGSYVGGDLIRLHLAAYTQAVSWGIMTSLAALVASLQWHRSQRAFWMAISGLSIGLAFLSKPEFGVSAACSVLAVLLSSRATPRIWIVWLASASLTIGVGFGWQASTSGWHALWRGVTGYDMVALGSFWGSEIAPIRWLASIAGFWSVVSLVLAGWRWPRWRPLSLSSAAGALILTVAAIAPMLLPVQTAETSIGEDVRWVVSAGLQWLMALPWGIVTPMLVGAAWVAKRRHAPPPWWGLWAFALATNLRLILTGYSSGVIVAPVLALFAWLLTSQNTEQATSVTATELSRRRIIAITTLVVLTVISILAQALTPDVAYGSRRQRFSTALGEVFTPWSPQVAELLAVQAEIQQVTPAEARIFAIGWGAGWYLLAQRENATNFDVMLSGLGATGQEARRLEEVLLRQPPAVIIMPTQHWSSTAPDFPRQANLYWALRTNLASWWASLSQNYAARPFFDEPAWQVLWRR